MLVGTFTFEDSSTCLQLHGVGNEGATMVVALSIGEDSVVLS